MRYNGKHIEFAKCLVGFLIFIYYVFYLFSVTMWFIDDRYMGEMLDYIYKPFAIITSAYLIQSSLNNKNKIKVNFKKEKQKKITFSKILVLLIILSFIISVFFFSISWVFLDRFPADLFNYIALPFLTILPSYIAKDIIEKNAEHSVNLTTFGNLVESITNLIDSGITSDTMQKVQDVKNVMNGLTKINEKGEVIEDDEELEESGEEDE